MTDNQQRIEPGIMSVENSTQVEKELFNLRVERDALQYKNEKLNKINAVLMQRVEMGWGNLSSAYSSFQNAALLAEKVKTKALKLRQAQSKLEAATLDLSRTRLESELSRQRLYDLIENVSDAIVLFDQDHRLILANRCFYEFWKNSGISITIGETRLGELLEMSHEYEIHDSIQATEVLKTEISIAKESAGEIGDRVLHLLDGRWLQMSERPTSDNGLVVVYTDITQIKENEFARQERVLAEKNRILQSMLDNLQQGASLVNADNKIESWNQRFLELIGLPISEINSGDDYLLLLKGTEVYEESKIFLSLQKKSDTTLAIYEKEKQLSNGVVLDIRSNQILGGGYVNTYTDITERRGATQQLKYAYQHMEHRVSERTRELKDLNEQLQLEIQERALIEKDLIKATLDAEEAIKSKVKFMTTSGHDLLQPLNAARLFSTALLESPLSEETRSLATSLNCSLNDVESIITTLVDISRLEAGVVEPVYDSFVINDLLSILSAEFHKQAQAVGLDFNYIDCHVVVNTDSQLLARILRNFLTNAIRYTESGKIRLGCRRRQQGLEIQVYDTGVGLTADQLPLIFHEFQQVHAKKLRDEKGLGLGLAIVVKLAEVLGSEVCVKSIPGRGSVFSICVPYGEETQKKPNVLLPIGQNNFLEGRRILIIDNEESICRGMSLVLSSWGCDVIAVQTVEELEVWEETLTPPPELMIADYHLDNGATGFDAINLVQEQLSYRLPVVLITANYTKELRRRASDLGYRLLNKPVKPLKLRSLLDNLFS
ncbi:MAG: PAS-domain containing protein [Porticoccus sp.]|nr:PAS-domain containing protein [Porticoccus sp.]MBQ0807556.1 PAS-domain containing protein [Porticoccus sp.]